MNKILLIAVICCLLSAGCNDADIGIIGGADGPTAIYVSDDNNKNIKPVRMANIDGKLYFELDEESDSEARCGVMDGEFTNTVGVLEVPAKRGEVNFTGAEGYQIGAINNTVEILLDGDWEIFGKIDTNSDVLKYKYCYTVEGRLHKAKDDSEFLVLSDTLDITFEDASYQLLGSDASKMKDIYVLPIVD